MKNTTKLQRSFLVLSSAIVMALSAYFSFAIPLWVVSTNTTTPASPATYNPSVNYSFAINWTNLANTTFQLGRPAGSLLNYTDNTTELVGYWRLNAVNGTNYTKDFSGYGNDGLLMKFDNGGNPPVNNFTAGKIGNALQFDGVNDYVDAGNAESLNITNAITIEAWIKPNIDYFTSNKEGEIINKDNAYMLGIWGQWDVVQFRLHISGVEKKIDYTVAPVANIWTHYIGTYNGSQMDFYKNGVLVKTVSSVTGSIDINTNGLIIGAQTPFVNYFDGSIDEVRIYNRSLSAAEIAAQYNQQYPYYAGTDDSLNGTWAINFTQPAFGPAGTYNYTWFGIDTAGLQNKSDAVNYVINKDATNMRLWLNGTQNNRSYIQNQVANFTAQLNVSGKTIFLKSNYTGWVMQSGTQTITNYTTLTTAGNFFNLTANWTGDENYTGVQTDYLFNVTGPTLRTAEETVTLSESYPELQNLFRASPETISLAEAQGPLRSVFVPVGELVSFGDILGRIANLFRAQPESVNIYDSVGKMRGVYQTQNELLSIGDISSISRNLYRIGSDLINLDDIVGRIASIFRANAETVNIYDSGGKLRSSYLASGELITLSDSNIKIRNIYLLQGEAINMLDSYSRILNLFRNSNENINFYDAQSRLLNLLRMNGDIISITDSGGKRFYLYRNSPETISVYDSGLKIRNVYNIQSELINFNDIASRIRSLFSFGGDTINILDSNSKMRSAYQAQNELLSLSDVGSRILNIFRSNPETITVMDSGGKIRNIYLSQNELISFYDIGSRILNLFRNIFEDIGITESQSENRNIFRASANTISFSDSSDRVRYVFFSVSDAINEYESQIKLRTVNILTGLDIAISDSGSRVLELFRNIFDTINIFDAANIPPSTTETASGGGRFIFYKNTVLLSDCNRDVFKNIYCQFTIKNLQPYNRTFSLNYYVDDYNFFKTIKIGANETVKQDINMNIDIQDSFLVTGYLYEDGRLLDSVSQRFVITDLGVVKVAGLDNNILYLMASVLIIASFAAVKYKSRRNKLKEAV